MNKIKQITTILLITFAFSSVSFANSEDVSVKKPFSFKRATTTTSAVVYETPVCNQPKYIYIKVNNIEEQKLIEKLTLEVENLRKEKAFWGKIIADLQEKVQKLSSINAKPKKNK